MKVSAKFTIAAEYAALVDPFVSKEETRYYLNGFYVEPHPKGGALVIATDGHLMAVFYDASGTCAKPGIVRLNKDMLKACVAGDRILAMAGDVISVLASRNSDADLISRQRDALIDGTFPDWRKCIPAAAAKRGTATFNAQLIRKFGVIARDGAKAEPIKILTSDSSSPALVLTQRTDFVGVIMPMRAVESNDLPPWLAPTPKAQVKKASPKKPAAKAAAAKIAPRKKAA